jgi:DUF2934 family protein
MSLIHYVRPFLELGICKEYRMARKTTGSTTPRSKKAEVPVTTAPVQVTAEVHTGIRKDVPRNGKPAKLDPRNVVPINLEEEIRRRAYELYLQRRASAGSDNGNQHQDWLVAEREILSRFSGQEQHTA